MRGWWVEGGRVAVVFNFFCTMAVFLVYFLAPWQFFWHHGSFFQFIFCHHGSYFSFFWHHGSLFSFFCHHGSLFSFFLPPWQYTSIVSRRILFLPTLQYPTFCSISQKSSLYIFTEKNRKEMQWHMKSLKEKGSVLISDSMAFFFTWAAGWILVGSSEHPRSVSREGPVNKQ